MSEILSYIDFMCIEDGDEADEFFLHVRALDTQFLADAREKRIKQQQKQQEEQRRQTRRR